jgi:hypothetical protein
VAKFSLHIKASAQKELDGVDNELFARIDRRVMSLADDPVSDSCNP